MGERLGLEEEPPREHPAQVGFLRNAVTNPDREHQVERCEHDDQRPSLDGNRNREDHYLRIRPEHGEGYRDSQYRPRGAHDRALVGDQSEEQGEQRGSHPTVEIVEHEGPRPHPVLDRSSEQVQPEHVRGEVENAPVDEQVAHRSPRLAGEPARVHREEIGDFRGGKHRFQQQLRYRRDAIRRATQGVRRGSAGLLKDMAMLNYSDPMRFPRCSDRSAHGQCGRSGHKGQQTRCPPPWPTGASRLVAVMPGKRIHL